MVARQDSLLASTSMNSVLQDWVMNLPLRAQGTLLTGIRGCDLAPKPHEPTPERGLVAFLRYCVMHPADPREIDIPNAFFRSKPPKDWKPSQLMHFPLHWYSHLMHCFEVVGYLGPHDSETAAIAFELYCRLAKDLHLNIETREQLLARLTEDRIANNSVVS